MAEKICTIGGGSGLPVVNQALVKAGFSNIYSIVTTFDSGGHTGRLRTDERGNLLAFSDYWRALISLWENGDQKRVWQKMLQFRDGRNRNFGNTFFLFMAEKTGNLSLVDNLFADLAGARIMGKVIPVSLKPADICFKTESGKKYLGEHRLDDLRMSFDTVKEAWLEPKVEANPEAVAALKSADVIIIAPGSLYGSIIVNFLPLGIKDAFNNTKAEKILITNLMSTANSTHQFDKTDYLEVFKQYLDKESLFDLIIMPDFEAFDEKDLDRVLEFYQLENSYPIKADKKETDQLLIADIALIEKENYRLRHSQDKLAGLLKQLLI